MPLIPCTPKRTKNLLACSRTRVYTNRFRSVFSLSTNFLIKAPWSHCSFCYELGIKTAGAASCRIEDTVDANGVSEPVMRILLELV